MEKINKKPYILTIVVLLIVSIGLGAYLVYDKFLMKQEENVETVIDNVSIDLNALYKVGDTLNNFDNAFNKNDSKYFEYLYKSDKINVKDFDMGAALFTSVKSDLIASNSNQTILGGRIKNNFTKMFGTNIKYTPGNIDAGDKYKINYNETTKTYSYTLQATNERKPEYLLKNTKTKLEDDKIIITRKLFYVEYSGNNAIIYKTSAKEKVGEVELHNDEVDVGEVIGKYGSRLKTYNYTFIENKADDYTFYRIELVK